MQQRRRKTMQRRQSSRRPVLAIAALAGVVVAVLGVAIAQRLGGSSQADLPQGTSRVGDIEASQPAVDLGHVPLNVAVQQKFVLRNVGTAPASLGEARIDVLEGC